MLPYWLMFFIPIAVGAISIRANDDLSKWIWLFVLVIFSLLIGLRFEVGGDWSNYVRNMSRGEGLGLVQGMGVLSSDPGYALVSWLSLNSGLGIYGSNLFAATVFMTGMVQFCRRQPLSWLGLLVAVPYMIVVFAMGYTRQTIAFGFELLALNALVDARIRKFVVLILIGAMFHKSAVILLPLAALVATGNRLWTMFWVGVCSSLGVALIVGERAGEMWGSYVAGGHIQSSGGGIRVALSALPAAIALLFQSRLFESEYERRLWKWVAIFTLICVPLVPFASTAVDRVALYFMPIQIIVFSRLHRIFDLKTDRGLLVISVIGFYALIQFVWLNFANHAHAWVPYRFAPFQ